MLPVTQPKASRSKLDIAISISILLMIAFSVFASSGSLTPTVAYAAVPM